MTAERWWVRLAARWLARVDGVSGQLRLAMLGLTGLSTASLTLRSYGHGEYAVPLIGLIAAGTIVYTYYYTEGGVWNQVSRDRNDLSSNFAPPDMMMNGTMTSVAMFVALNEREPTEEEREQLEEAMREQWRQYRDGIEIKEEER